MKKIDTIIFDLDGTLIDTNKVIIESFKEVFRVHYPDNMPTEDVILSFIGPTLVQSFGTYTNSMTKIDEMIKTYRDFYVVYEVGNHELYPYVKEVLAELKKMGYNLAILTSKFNIAAWPSYTHYNLDDDFDSFTGLDDVKHAKPHKNSIETVLKHYPQSIGAIMIGDNQGDILAGKNAGIFSAGVAWSIKGKEYLLQVEPDYILNNMKDIFRVLEDIEGGQ